MINMHFDAEVCNLEINSNQVFNCCYLKQTAVDTFVLLQWLQLNFGGKQSKEEGKAFLS